MRQVGGQRKWANFGMSGRSGEAHFTTKDTKDTKKERNVAPRRELAFDP